MIQLLGSILQENLVSFPINKTTGLTFTSLMKIKTAWHIILYAMSSNIHYLS
jgi:hypothetical protein